MTPRFFVLANKMPLAMAIVAYCVIYPPPTLVGVDSALNSRTGPQRLPGELPITNRFAPRTRQTWLAEFDVRRPRDYLPVRSFTTIIPGGMGPDLARTRPAD